MKSKMSAFEAAMGELEDILQKMSGEQVNLEESVRLYARAAELISQCSEGLDEAKVKIEEIDLKMQEIKLGDDDGI